MTENERGQPGPRPSLHSKRLSIHYRVNHDMRELIVDLKRVLKCTSEQDVIDECVMLMARKMQPPVYRVRWLGKRW